jgi:perosamine synthetase
MYGVVLTEGAELDALQFAKALKERGVETRPFFLGMHEQPALQRRGLFLNEKYPVAETLARQGLYLPSGLALTAAQLGCVCEAVREVLS